MAGLILIGAGVTCAPTSADVIEFTEKDQWLAAVGAFSTADFVGIAHNTVMTNQYADLGVIFTEANDTVVCCGKETFPEDAAGLDGNGTITVAFDSPMFWIGVDYPGALTIELFWKGRLVYESEAYGGGGVGFFTGLLSIDPFDEARLVCPVANATFVDDIHFGPPMNSGDLDGDGDVDTTDLINLLGLWGRCAGADCIACPADLDADCLVGPSDLITLLGNWG